MNIRSCIRNYVLSDEEQKSLGAWSTFVFPEKHLYIGNGVVWDSSNPGADLSWGRGGIQLGWIQSITHDQNLNRLTINHFAIDKAFVGIGLGTRLARSFGQAVNMNANVKEILFTERSQNNAYRCFFNKLGATETSLPYSKYEWLWTIP